MNRYRRTDYGIDAPGLLNVFFLGVFVAYIAWLAAFLFLDGATVFGRIARPLAVLTGLYCAGMGILMLYWSKKLKVREREGILGAIPWRGDEQVLDVGCGRGLMLVGAALRLNSGKALGVDVWQGRDQSFNEARHALENARREGVAEKVEVQTADMRALPMADKTMDVVVSHWAVHNLATEADRQLALTEMQRVLRPGGYLILTDIEFRQFYQRQLTTLGFTQIRLVVSPWRDKILRAVSFGSFGPATIYARKAG